MKLIIDNRERDLLNIIPTTIPHEKKSLDLGDIIITDDSNTHLLVIERKTVKDLASSIKDGRYREQKARLISCYLNNNIPVMYIIENFEWTPDAIVNGIPYTTLMSSIINTMLRDKIQVYKSNSLNETRDFIIAMYNKFPSTPSITPPKYLENGLKLKKKENKKDADSMIFILCQVPRVSVAIARVIREHYATVRCLVIAFSDTKRLLSDIKVNNRRIGHIMSENIYKYLCE